MNSNPVTALGSQLPGEERHHVVAMMPCLRHFANRLMARKREDAEAIADLVNAAYRAGKADMREEFRDLLGIKSDES